MKKIQRYVLYQIFRDVGNPILEKLMQIRLPTVDIIRTHLHKPAETNLIHMSNDIEVAAPDLVRFDKKCGVS